MKKESDCKIFTLRLSHELWRNMRKIAWDREISVNTLILDRLEKYKNKSEKRVDDK